MVPNRLGLHYMLPNIVNIISITNSRLSKDSGVGTLQLSIGIFVIMWEVTEQSSCRTGTPEKGEEDSNVGAAVPLVSVSGGERYSTRNSRARGAQFPEPDSTSDHTHLSVNGTKSCQVGSE